MKNRQASLIFIFITILIDVIGFGLIIPVMPTLVTKLGHIDLSSAAYYSGWMMFAYATMQFIFSPVMGALSDRFGRRPVLFISLAGLTVDYIIMAVAPDLTWLFIGRIFAGIMGASFTTASAYIADISTPEKRAQNFGMIGVAFGVGFIIGPLLGSVLAKWGMRIPFYFAAGFSLLNLLYGIIAIPESLTKENRRPFSWKRANPVGAFYQVSKYPQVIGLLFPVALTYIAHHAVQSNWNYYTILKFQWDESMVGYSLAFVGLVVAIVQGGLIRIILPKLGQKRAIMYGMFFTMLGFVLFGIANQSWMMYAFLVPYALGGIAGPAMQGLMSNEVPSNAQGEFQGIMTSVMSLTMIIGPLLMNFIFGFFTAKNAPVYFPGAAMMTGAFLVVVAMVITLPVLKRLKEKK